MVTVGIQYDPTENEVDDELDDCPLLEQVTITRYNMFVFVTAVAETVVVYGIVVPPVILVQVAPPSADVCH